MTKAGAVGLGSLGVLLIACLCVAVQLGSRKGIHGVMTLLEQL